jgi:hypothetical protein
MSAYKKIKTEYKTLKSLLDALRDLGYNPDVAPNPKENSISLIGYLGDVRPEKAVVRIPRQQVGRASNDVGFCWTGSEYEAIISDFDNSRNFDLCIQQSLKQRYTLHETKRLAALQGYSLQEQVLADGTIRLTCTSLGY